MKLLLLLLIFSFPLSAQRNLTKEAFQVNVRPVLNGILNDFYQMISLFPDFPREIVSIIDKIDSIEEDKENFKESCPRFLNKSCNVNVIAVRKKLQTIRNLTISLQARQKMSSSFYLNSLTGMRILSQFDSTLEEVKGLFDNASFLHSAKIPHKVITHDLIKKLDELNTYLSLAIVEFIPYSYKDDFRHFYFNFVRPVQLQISKRRNYEFLNQNVNSLNFAINLLNMNLTKRNKRTPEGMGPYLSTIHNKWNRLLRYYF